MYNANEQNDIINEIVLPSSKVNIKETPHNMECPYYYRKENSLQPHYKIL